MRYPHHESEIAQSENFTGKKPFVSYWMHTGAVMYEGEKMSKSLGNLIMVSDLLKTYSPNAIRYLLLSHHYHEPWEYSRTELDEAAKKIQAIEKRLQKLSPSTTDVTDSSLLQSFSAALADDLDTPKALELLTETTNKGLLTQAKKMVQILGFLLPERMK